MNSNRIDSNILKRPLDNIRFLINIFQIEAAQMTTKLYSTAIALIWKNLQKKMPSKVGTSEL